MRNYQRTTTSMHQASQQTLGRSGTDSHARTNAFYSKIYGQTRPLHLKTCMCSPLQCMKQLRGTSVEQRTSLSRCAICYADVLLRLCLELGPLPPAANPLRRLLNMDPGSSTPSAAAEAAKAAAATDASKWWGTNGLGDGEPGGIQFHGQALRCNPVHFDFCCCSL